MKLFIDTNVVIDVLAQRQGFYDASAAILTMLEKDEAEGFISAISFNNIHYILRKQSGKTRADNAIRMLLSAFNIVTLDEKILTRTIESNFNDFEDGIQFFSAMRSNADYLISRNVRDFPHDDIPVLTPEEFLQLDFS
ncbi:MAG: PIN domain-containing protein [Victivallaceae bacterium]